MSGTDGIESDSEEEDLELVLETLLEGVRRQRRMSGTPPRADVSNGQEPRETLIRFLVARFTAGLRVAIPVVEEFPSQSEFDAAYDVGTSLGRAVRERHRGSFEDRLAAGGFPLLIPDKGTTDDEEPLARRVLDVAWEKIKKQKKQGTADDEEPLARQVLDVTWEKIKKQKKHQEEELLLREEVYRAQERAQAGEEGPISGRKRKRKKQKKE